MRRSCSSKAALCCSCFSFFFVIFPLAGTYMIWGRTGDFAREPVFGTGPFFAGGVRVLEGSNITGFSTQRLSWDDIHFAKPSACVDSTENNDMFSNWSGRYGFCTGEGGEFFVPPSIRVIQTFLIFNVILLAVLMCVGCLRPALERPVAAILPPMRTAKGTAGCAAVLAILACASTVITFGVIAATPWYQDLRDPSRNSVFMPLINNDGMLVAVDVTEVDFVYGPTFAVLILCFVAAFFTTGLYTALWKWPEMQVEKGYYGQQDNHPEDGYSESFTEDGQQPVKDTSGGKDPEAPGVPGDKPGLAPSGGKDTASLNAGEQVGEAKGVARALEEDAEKGEATTQAEPAKTVQLG